MLEALNNVIALFKPDPQQQDRAQAQLAAALDHRFAPCLELWQECWRFAETVNSHRTNYDTAPAPIDSAALHLRDYMGNLLATHGAVLSTPLLLAVDAYRGVLRDFTLAATSDRALLVPGLLGNLYPKQLNDPKRKAPGTAPGILFLVRDDVGSNTRAASSALQP
jgi:hypothetical protein